MLYPSQVCKNGVGITCPKGLLFFIAWVLCSFFSHQHLQSPIKTVIMGIFRGTFHWFSIVGFWCMFLNRSAPPCQCCPWRIINPVRIYEPISVPLHVHSEIQRAWSIDIFCDSRVMVTTYDRLYGIGYFWIHLWYTFSMRTLFWNKLAFLY